MHYLVKGEEFPGTLKGLTEAIELASEFAYSEPVDVYKINGDETHIAYHVGKQERKRKERPGYWEGNK